MRNNFCRLVEPELKKLDADVPLDLMGMLWSPFHMTERNGYIHVPVESFQEITNFLTDHALHLAAARQQHAAQDALQQRLAEAEKKLDPVDGDLLPAVGSKVLIHLARSDSWAEHTVVGYYAWDNHGLDKNVHRVFVRVRDSQGYLNARLLNDIRLASPGCADGEKAPAPAVNLPRRKVKTEYSTAEEDAQADAWNAALDAVQELNR